MRKSLTAFVAVAILAGMGGTSAAASPAARPDGRTGPPRPVSGLQQPARASGTTGGHWVQAPAAPAANPIAGNQGFPVFVKGNATLNKTASGGPVALGGNLTVGSGSFNVASQTAGTFTASGDSRPTGLLVGGSINWAAAGSTGR